MSDPKKASLKQWFPWNPTQYLADTTHLSALADCAYRRLLDQYWIKQGPLTADEKRLARLIRYSPDEWAEVREDVLEFFYIGDDNRLHNKRADEELADAFARYERRSKAGKQGGRPRKNQSESNAKAIETSNDDDNDDDDDNLNPLDSFNRRGNAVDAVSSPPKGETLDEYVMRIGKAVLAEIPEKYQGRRMAEIYGYVSKWNAQGYGDSMMLEAAKLAVAAVKKKGDVITSPSFIESFFQTVETGHPD